MLKESQKKSYEVEEILSLIGITSNNLNPVEKEIFKETNIKKKLKIKQQKY